mgnify:CR=1 FL=1
MAFSSIKKRILFSVALFLGAVLSLTAIGTYAYFRHETTHLIHNQQYSMLSGLATGLDDKLSTAHNSIEKYLCQRPVSVYASRQTVC